MLHGSESEVSQKENRLNSMRCFCGCGLWIENKYKLGKFLKLKNGQNGPVLLPKNIATVLIGNLDSTR